MENTALLALIEQLNGETKEIRQNALKEIKKLTDLGEIPAPKKTDFVNNHIHTTYSFSPYSPTKAVYMAWQAGLSTAGIMDHDTISGAEEFYESAAIIGMPSTIGLECRADMTATRLCGKKINNPDQISVAYIALHGVPHQSIGEIDAFFKPYREKRNERNRKMCQNIAKIIASSGMTFDFDTDVIPLSQYKNGGSVTERHILFALAKKIIAKCGSISETLRFMQNVLHVKPSDSARKKIEENNPAFVEYDILGLLKSEFAPRFYIEATEETPLIADVKELAERTGAILAYPYLGDVAESPTGDKKAQKFEDDYIDLLFAELKSVKFDAVTFMPSRNTLEQLQRLMKLCDEYEFFQISGEDINSPRQSFICPFLEKEEFAHLKTSTYALIGHEIAATKEFQLAMFSPFAKLKFPVLDKRVKYYSEIGMAQSAKL